MEWRASAAANDSPSLGTDASVQKGSGMTAPTGSCSKIIHNKLSAQAKMELHTSPSSQRAREAVLKDLCMASHAHRSFPRVHGSGSSFRRGVNIVGHNADFNVREAGVNAEEDGTLIIYGGGSSRSEGGSGSAIEEGQRSSVVVALSLCFRMRLR